MSSKSDKIEAIFELVFSWEMQNLGGSQIWPTFGKTDPYQD